MPGVRKNSTKKKIKDCKSCGLKTDNALDCEMYSVSAKNDIARGRQCEYFEKTCAHEKENQDPGKDGQNEESISEKSIN